jgi:CTP synthase (UTP-ammonia lyase)
MKLFHIALVGDQDSSVTAHVAIPQALELSALATGVSLQFEWVATRNLPDVAPSRLDGFAAIWCVPASPYESTKGALDAIRYARESRIPFLGTCGGYQHAVLEYARDVLGYAEADNAEVTPDAEMPLISPLSCSLVEASDIIEFVEGSYIHGIYGNSRTAERYRCSYGVDARYLSIFDGCALEFVGFDAQREPRAFELKSHPFFIGTAFQPERSALEGETHPLVTAYVRAAAGSLALCA